VLVLVEVEVVDVLKTHVLMHLEILRIFNSQLLPAPELVKTYRCVPAVKTLLEEVLFLIPIQDFKATERSLDKNEKVK